MAFEEAASEDLKKNEKNMIGVSESLATLSPMVRGKEKMWVIQVRRHFQGNELKVWLGFSLLLVQM